MQNHLKDQTSPYLLQHADNPVNWYPWCDEAFARAKAEDKPILLQADHMSWKDTESLKKLYEYRKGRYALHLDDKILTSWNGLMIAAMCHLYRVTGKKAYLNAAETAWKFIEEKLCEKDVLYVSYRQGQHSGKGFLDDYANQAFALLALYGATLEKEYLPRACVPAAGE